jgi:hypothetical protein
MAAPPSPLTGADGEVFNDIANHASQFDEDPATCEVSEGVGVLPDTPVAVFEAPERSPYPVDEFETVESRSASLAESLGLSSGSLPPPSGGPPANTSAGGVDPEERLFVPADLGCEDADLLRRAAEAPCADRSADSEVAETGARLLAARQEVAFAEDSHVASVDAETAAVLRLQLCEKIVDIINERRGRSPAALPGTPEETSWRVLLAEAEGEAKFALLRADEAASRRENASRLAESARLALQRAQFDHGAAVIKRGLLVAEAGSGAVVDRLFQSTLSVAQHINEVRSKIALEADLVPRVAEGAAGAGAGAGEEPSSPAIGAWDV